MTDVVIVSAVRTALGRLGGALKDVQPEELARIVIAAAVERAGVEPAAVDEVVMGQTKQSADAANIARVAALKAGFPVEVPAYTVMRQCGSGLQAVGNALQAIRAGDAEIVVAGGVESMSLAPYYLRGARFGFGSGNAVVVDPNTESQPRSQPYEVYGDLTMGLTAENLAERYGITREEQDAFALRSQERAFAAIERGPVRGRDRARGGAGAQGPGGGLRRRRVSAPHQPRAARRPRALLQGGRHRHRRQLLRPQRRRRLPRAHVGATRPGRAASRRSRPSAATPSPASTRGTWASGPSPPRARRSSGPASPSPRSASSRSTRPSRRRRSPASASSAWTRTTLNVNGGAIALGHPLGCSGARILTTLLHEMRKRGTRYGLAGICIAGGQGMATIIETAG